MNVLGEMGLVEMQGEVERCRVVGQLGEVVVVGGVSMVRRHGFVVSMLYLN